MVTYPAIVTEEQAIGAMRLLGLPAAIDQDIMTVTITPRSITVTAIMRDQDGAIVRTGEDGTIATQITVIAVRSIVRESSDRLAAAMKTQLERDQAIAPLIPRPDVE